MHHSAAPESHFTAQTDNVLTTLSTFKVTLSYNEEAGDFVEFSVLAAYPQDNVGCPVFCNEYSTSEQALFTL